MQETAQCVFCRLGRLLKSCLLFSGYSVGTSRDIAGNLVALAYVLTMKTL